MSKGQAHKDQRCNDNGQDAVHQNFSAPKLQQLHRQRQDQLCLLVQPPQQAVTKAARDVVGRLCVCSSACRVQRGMWVRTVAHCLSSLKSVTRVRKQQHHTCCQKQHARGAHAAFIVGVYAARCNKMGVHHTCFERELQGHHAIFDSGLVLPRHPQLGMWCTRCQCDPDQRECCRAFLVVSEMSDTPIAHDQLERHCFYDRGQGQDNECNCVGRAGAHCLKSSR